MTSARERLIDTATALFNRHGFHATGVDRIVAVANLFPRIWPSLEHTVPRRTHI